MNKVEMDELMGQLRAGKTKVIFTKVDGAERTMFCTLNLSMVPKEHMPTTQQAVSTEDGYNPVALRVYDLERAGWRSFRLESVKSHVRD